MYQICARFLRILQEVVIFLTSLIKNCAKLLASLVRLVYVSMHVSKQPFFPTKISDVLNTYMYIMCVSTLAGVIRM